MNLVLILLNNNLFYILLILYNCTSDFYSYTMTKIRAIVVIYSIFAIMNKICNLIFQLLNNDFFIYKDYNLIK